MKCIHCNRIIPGDASFCPYCGQDQDIGSLKETDELKEQLLKQLSEEITGELPDVPWDERDRREYRREYVRREPVKSSKRYLGVIAVVVMVMALMMVAIWIVFTTMDANERRMLEDQEQELSESLQKEQEEAASKDKKDKKDPDGEGAAGGKDQDGEEEIRLAFVGEPGDFEEYYKLPVAEAFASSVISQEGTDNGAHKAVDGNSKTSWQEGVNGDGIGESIHLKLSKPYLVKYMSFQLGNWTSAEYYDGNNRPKELEITAGDVTQTVTFPDGKVEYWVEFSKECQAQEIEVVIKSVYEGSKWDDTCIAEIGIYGKGK